MPDTVDRPSGRWHWLLALVLGLPLVLLGGVATTALQRTVLQKDQLISGEARDVLEVERLRSATERESRLTRGLLLAPTDEVLSRLRVAQAGIEARVEQLRGRITEPEDKQLLARFVEAEALFHAVADRAIKLRRTERLLEALTVFEEDVRPARQQLEGALDALAVHQQREFEDASRRSSAQAARTLRGLLAVVIAASSVAALLALLLLRSFGLQRRQRAQLEASVRGLAAANRDLDAFAGRVAHDLRNVLAPLPPAVHRLRRSPDEEAVEAGARVERVANRAMALMDALLSFSRAEHAVTDGAAGSLPRAVEDALEDLKPAMQALGARVELDVEAAQVRCSGGLLHLVVANLVGNALKFLEGRGERVVRVSARADGRFGRLTVEDTGPGIPAAALARIFEPFYRVPGSRVAGSGIGLATVQRIVHAHDGTIDVDSELERGTRFVIRLPLAGEASPALLAGGDQRQASGAHAG